MTIGGCGVCTGRGSDWMPANGDEAPLIGRLRRRPQRQHRLQVLDGARALVLEGYAERVELRLQVADAEAEDQPPAGHHVDARQLLGEHERIALRQDDDAGAEAQALACARRPRSAPPRDRGTASPAASATAAPADPAGRRARPSTPIRSRPPRPPARSAPPSGRWRTAPTLMPNSPNRIEATNHRCSPPMNTAPRTGSAALDRRLVLTARRPATNAAQRDVRRLTPGALSRLIAVRDTLCRAQRRRADGRSHHARPDLQHRRPRRLRRHDRGRPLRRTHRRVRRDHLVDARSLLGSDRSRRTSTSTSRSTCASRR